MFFLNLVFLSEVFFNINDYYLSTFLIYSFVLYLYFLKSKNKKFKLPKTFFFFILLFSMCFFLSLPISVTKKNSLIAFLNYVNLILIAIYSYNFKKEAKNFFLKNLKIIKFLAALFLLLNIIFPGKFIPQLSLIWHNQHSQISNFFIIPFILNPSIFWLILLIIGFSRSTIVSLGLILFIKIIKKFLKEKQLDKKKIILLFFLILILILISINFFSFLPYKKNSILGNRTTYYLQALNYIIKNPFGAGLDNFEEVSKQMSLNISDWSFSSHNLILDFTSEMGVIMGFLLLLFYKKIIYDYFNSKEDKFHDAFLGLSIIFLLDYTFKFLFFQLMYFLLLGITLNEKKTFFLNSKDKVIFINLITFLLIIISDAFFNLKLLRMTLIFNPLNHDAVKEIIIKNETKKNSHNKLWLIYFLLLKNDIYSKVFFYKINEKEKNEKNLEDLIISYPAYYLDSIPHYLKLLNEKYGNIKFIKIEKILKKILNKYTFIKKESEVYRNIIFYCTRLNLQCQ